MRGKACEAKKRDRLKRAVACAVIVCVYASCVAFYAVNIRRREAYAAMTDAQIAAQAADMSALPEDTQAPTLQSVGVIDINSADMETLCLLPGIGQATALSIADYRQSAGGFESAQDIMSVGGIGEKTYDRIAPYITAAAAQTSTPDTTPYATPPSDAQTDVQSVPPSDAQTDVQPTPPCDAQAAQAQEGPATEPVADQEGRININSATAQELEALPGIGEKLAQRIIQYRDEHGDFADVQDIMNVSGIARKKFDAIKDLICVQ